MLEVKLKYSFMKKEKSFVLFHIRLKAAQKWSKT
jgi:hypothetical protein